MLLACVEVDETPMSITSEEQFQRACESWRIQMTPKRRELFDLMVSKIGHGWEFVPTFGFTIRWDRELTTPEWAKETGRYLPSWNEPTYPQHVFLTLVSFKSNPILGVSSSPWVSRQDTSITLKRALEILNDPAEVLD